MTKVTSDGPRKGLQLLVYSQVVINETNGDNDLMRGPGYGTRAELNPSRPNRRE